MTEDSVENSTPTEFHDDEQDILPQGQYVIGVGGCGNNLVDSLLLRNNPEGVKESLLKEKWDQISAGQAMVNSHLTELANSYYFTEIKDEQPGLAADKYAFGHDGAGSVWERAENMLTRHMELQGSWNDQWGDDLQISRIQNASSIWLLRSAVGGTGAGATPKFAKELQYALNNESRPRLLDFPILSMGNPTNVGNVKTLIGLSRLAIEVDGTIPTDNNFLTSNTSLNNYIDIEYTDWDQMYSEENEIISAFLELMGGCLSSNHSFGNHLDVTDLYRPVEYYYPTGEGTPISILAPALGKYHPDEPEATIPELFEDGKLIDFDPASAWGVSLIFCGPPDEMEKPIGNIRNQNLSDQVNEYLYTGEERPFDPFINAYTIGLSDLDDIWVMAFVANPEIPAISRAYNTVQEIKTMDIPIGESIEKHWDSIERLVTVLQNKPSDLVD